MSQNTRIKEKLDTFKEEESVHRRNRIKHLATSPTIRNFIQSIPQLDATLGTQIIDELEKEMNIANSVTTVDIDDNICVKSAFDKFARKCYAQSTDKWRNYYTNHIDSKVIAPHITKLLKHIFSIFSNKLTAFAGASLNSNNNDNNNSNNNINNELHSKIVTLYKIELLMLIMTDNIKIKVKGGGNSIPLFTKKIFKVMNNEFWKDIIEIIINEFGKSNEINYIANKYNEVAENVLKILKSIKEEEKSKLVQSHCRVSPRAVTSQHSSSSSLERIAVDSNDVINTSNIEIEASGVDPLQASSISTIDLENIAMDFDYNSLDLSNTNAMNAMNAMNGMIQTDTNIANQASSYQEQFQSQREITQPIARPQIQTNINIINSNTNYNNYNGSNLMNNNYNTIKPLPPPPPPLPAPAAVPAAAPMSLPCGQTSFNTAMLEYDNPKPQQTARSDSVRVQGCEKCECDAYTSYHSNAGVSNDIINVNGPNINYQTSNAPQNDRGYDLQLQNVQNMRNMQGMQDAPLTQRVQSHNKVVNGSFSSNLVSTMSNARSNGMYKQSVQLSNTLMMQSNNNNNNGNNTNNSNNINNIGNYGPNIAHFRPYSSHNPLNVGNSYKTRQMSNSQQAQLPVQQYSHEPQSQDLVLSQRERLQQHQQRQHTAQWSRSQLQLCGSTSVSQMQYSQPNGMNMGGVASASGRYQTSPSFSAPDTTTTTAHGVTNMNNSNHNVSNNNNISNGVFTNYNFDSSSMRMSIDNITDYNGVSSGVHAHPKQSWKQQRSDRQFEHEMFANIEDMATDLGDLDTILSDANASRRSVVTFNSPNSMNHYRAGQHTQHAAVSMSQPNYYGLGGDKSDTQMVRSNGISAFDGGYSNLNSGCYSLPMSHMSHMSHTSHRSHIPHMLSYNMSRVPDMSQSTQSISMRLQPQTQSQGSLQQTGNGSNGLNRFKGANSIHGMN